MELINSKSYNKKKNKKHLIAHKLSLPLLVLVISLPLLYVSLLHLPISSLLKDTTFWFLIANSIIFIVAADSGMFSSSSSTSDQIYDEFIKHSRAAVREIKEQTVILEEYNVEEQQEQEVSKEPMSEAESPKAKEEEEVVVVVEEEKLQVVPKSKYSRSHSTEIVPAVLADDSARASKWVPRSASMVVEKRRCGMEESEYWKMSDDELNKRVEEFIRRFNRGIRLEAKMMSRTTAAVY